MVKAMERPQVANACQLDTVAMRSRQLFVRERAADIAARARECSGSEQTAALKA